MMKLCLSLVGCAMLIMAIDAYSQESTLDSEILKTADADTTEELKETLVDEMTAKHELLQTEDSLWEKTQANLNAESLSVFLAAFPDGKYSDDAELRLEVFEQKTRARAKQDNELAAYRKHRIAGGLVLEIDSKFADVKPYFRSMLNSCGYTLVEPHRFAKRVYPTLDVKGQMFNSKSDDEYLVTLYLTLVLISKTREIKAREKITSYRASKIDTHQALIAGFEDVGAQMKSKGYCL